MVEAVREVHDGVQRVHLLMGNRGCDGLLVVELELVVLVLKDVVDSGDREHEGRAFLEHDLLDMKFQSRDRRANAL